jgi:hypothetical protein
MPAFAVHAASAACMSNRISLFFDKDGYIREKPFPRFYMTAGRIFVEPLHEIVLEAFR